MVENTDDDVTNAKALLKILQEKDKKPNMMTLDDFRRYIPLFKYSNNSKEGERRKLVELADEYLKKINPYKVTVIIRSLVDNTPVITLPRIFAPVRQLSPTELNAFLVSRNQKMSQSMAVPRHRAEAFMTMAQALIDEQKLNADLIRLIKDESVTIMDQLREQYGYTSSENESSIEDKIADLDNSEWEFL